MNSLDSLANFNDNDRHETVDQLHPKHAESPIVLGITKRNKFLELSRHVKKKERIENSSEADQKIMIKDNRESHFTIGHCDTWGCNFIPRGIKRLRRKYQLTWVRTRMACRMFENIEELLISNRNNRVASRWTLKNFKQRECNCNNANKDENSKFILNGQCRMCCVAHELQFKICKKKHT